MQTGDYVWVSLGNAMKAKQSKAMQTGDRDQLREVNNATKKMHTLTDRDAATAAAALPQPQWTYRTQLEARWTGWPGVGTRLQAEADSESDSNDVVRSLPVKAVLRQLLRRQSKHPWIPSLAPPPTEA
jgi:hypothetical protein